MGIPNWSSFNRVALRCALLDDPRAREADALADQFAGDGLYRSNPTILSKGRKA